jgi:Aminoglycoside N3''-acetyltransferase
VDDWRAAMAGSTGALGRKDIVAGLERLGLRRGDRVLVHSSLSSFGPVTGGADTVIDALLEAVGETGTVVVPTFGCSDEVFDPSSSETGLGVIPRVFWKRPGALRSRHPLASAAAIGPDAEELIRDHEKADTGHGEGTPYHRLYERAGKILLLGVDQDRSTFLHTAEELSRLPYLRPSTARYLDERGAVVRATWAWFPGPHRDFIGLQRSWSARAS